MWVKLRDYAISYSNNINVRIGFNSNNINVPYTGGNDLVKESDKPFRGMPIKF